MMIGSAVHTTNPMHHPLHRSELCNRIHHKHRWEGDDDDKHIDASYDDDDKYIDANYDVDDKYIDASYDDDYNYIDAYHDDDDNHVFEISELHRKQQRDVDDGDNNDDITNTSGL